MIRSLDNLIRMTLRAWHSWRTKKKLYRACPEMRDIDASIEEARRRHVKHSHLADRKRKLMLGLMRGG